MNFTPDISGMGPRVFWGCVWFGSSWYELLPLATQASDMLAWSKR